MIQVGNVGRVEPKTFRELPNVVSLFTCYLVLHPSQTSLRRSLAQAVLQVWKSIISLVADSDLGIAGPYSRTSTPDVSAPP